MQSWARGSAGASPAVLAPRQKPERFGCVPSSKAIRLRFYETVPREAHGTAGEAPALPGSCGVDSPLVNWTDLCYRYPW